MIIDSWSWIEHLKETEKGKKVKEILLREKCYTCNISLAEITEWGFKNNMEDKVENIKNNIKIASTIIEMNDEIVNLAGEINFKRKNKVKNWGLMDSFILATANLKNLKILTGDKHFMDLPNAVIL